MRYRMVGCVLAAGVLALMAGCGGSDADDAGGPGVEESELSSTTTTEAPSTTAAPSTTTTTAVPVDVPWDLSPVEVTRNDGWVYTIEPMVDGLFEIEASKDVSTSPPGSAKLELTIEVPDFSFEATSADPARTAPEMVLGDNDLICLEACFELEIPVPRNLSGATSTDGEGAEQCQINPGGFLQSVGYPSTVAAINCSSRVMPSSTVSASFETDEIWVDQIINALVDNPQPILIAKSQAYGCRVVLAPNGERQAGCAEG